MRINYHRYRFGLVLGLLMALVGCGREAETGPPIIAATIYPLGSLVQELVGDAVEVATIIPPGASEHATEIPPASMAKLSRARILVAVGMNLDDWLVTMGYQTGRKNLTVVRFDDLVGKREKHDHSHDHHHHGHDHGHSHDHHGHDHSGPNPHLWLDPVQTKTFVAGLGGKLAELLPEHAQEIAANTQRLLGELDMLHEEYTAGLTGVTNKRLVTFHNAFDPLAERYGLEVVTHLTDIDISPGGEVAPQRLVQAIEAVKKHELKVLYAEPQFAENAVEAIRRETGAAVLRLDPLGRPGAPGYETYLELMRSNLKTLVDGQSR